MFTSLKNKLSGYWSAFWLAITIISLVWLIASSVNKLNNKISKTQEDQECTSFKLKTVYIINIIILLLIVFLQLPRYIVNFKQNVNKIYNYISKEIELKNKV